MTNEIVKPYLHVSKTYGKEYLNYSDLVNMAEKEKLKLKLPEIVVPEVRVRYSTGVSECTREELDRDLFSAMEHDYLNNTRLLIEKAQFSNSDAPTQVLVLKGNFALNYTGDLSERRGQDVYAIYEVGGRDVKSFAKDLIMKMERAPGNQIDRTSYDLILGNCLDVEQEAKAAAERIYNARTEKKFDEFLRQHYLK